jgi:hypothetical protein
MTEKGDGLGCKAGSGQLIYDNSDSWGLKFLSKQDWNLRPKEQSESLSIRAVDQVVRNYVATVAIVRAIPVRRIKSLSPHKITIK